MFIKSYGMEEKKKFTELYIFIGIVAQVTFGLTSNFAGLQLHRLTFS